MQTETKPARRERVERGVYKNPSTGRYEVQYTDSDGRIRWQTVTGGLTAARLTRAEILTRLGRGERIAFSSRTLRQLFEEWLPTKRRLRKRVKENYELLFAKHVDGCLGMRRASDIRVDAVAQLVATLEGRGLSGSTIRGVLTVLGQVFAYAVRRGIVAENPVRLLERDERPKLTRREMRVLERYEIQALLESVTPAYRAVIATAIFTGLRQGELLGLTWADIDFANSTINVRCQLDRDGERSEPKTERAVRSVILMPSLALLLREHKLASAFSSAEDPVFATRTGKPMHYRNVSRRGFTAAVGKAGLNPPGVMSLRFHDLRHTFASILIAEGLNVVFVSRQLGHSTPSFTLNVYSHLFDQAEHARRASAALEAGFAGLLPH